MAGWTDKGIYQALGIFFRDETAPAQFNMALCTDATAPDSDTVTLSELTQIGTGTGYSDGGLTVERSATGFDVENQNQTNDRGELQIKDLVWTASGGSVGPARYAVLTDNNATVSAREVWCYWDLGQNYTATNGQTLTLADFEVRGFHGGTTQWTNRGKQNFLKKVFKGDALGGADFQVKLMVTAGLPTADTNAWSEIEANEIAGGNGYTSDAGLAVLSSAVGFDVWTEGVGFAEVELADLVWTASGGPLPSSGGGARYAVLTDSNVTPGSRDVICWWDLTSDRSVSDTQTLTLQNFSIRGVHS